MTSMPLIRSIDELTPSIMTDVMRSRGGLTGDQSVVGVDSESFGDSAGLLSYLYRTSLTYSDDAAGPASVVVKIPTDDPAQRGIADALGFFNRECVFYNEVASNAPFRSPIIYGQAQADDSTDFIIIMEDLGHMERIDQVVGATPDEAKTVLVPLAKLHAEYWGHESLPGLAETFLPIDNPVYHAALTDVFGAGWAAVNQHAPEIIEERIKDFGNHYARHLPFLLRSLTTPQTLLHGDYRSDNLLLDDAGSLAVVDYQIMSVGNGGFDLGYFLSQSVTTETRNAHGEELIRLYHQTLTDGGVDLAFDDLMVSYRQALAFCPIYSVASFAGWESFSDRQKDLMKAMFTRSAASIVDTDALATLPSL